MLARYRYEVHCAANASEDHLVKTLVDGDGIFSFSFLLPACNLNVQQTHAQTALYAAAVVQVAKVLVTWKWFKVLVTAACNSDVQDILAETALDVAA